MNTVFNVCAVFDGCEIAAAFDHASLADAVECIRDDIAAGFYADANPADIVLHIAAERDGRAVSQTLALSAVRTH